VESSESGEKRVQMMVRIPMSLVKENDHLTVDLDKYRGETMALLMREALDRRKMPDGGPSHQAGLR
jgi:hypothetical protein